MGLFKAKTREIESFETDVSIPAFRIDSNGFVMFTDKRLGGAAVFEVRPSIHTEAITHEDPVFHNESTRFYDNPDYEPSNNALFGNARAVVYPGWVHFLNSLQETEDGLDGIHIQILAKKCLSDEWQSKIDYAVCNAHKDLDSLIYARDHGNDPHAAMLGARADDYLALLEHTQKITQEIPSTVSDIRKLTAYKVKFYLVVSYTQSAEGWWRDGRDCDFYFSDTKTGNTLFADSEDKLVDRVTSIIGKRRDRKAERSDLEGAEDDLFWVESDRTAQIISTRVHRIMNSIKKWNMTHKDREMPFDIIQMDGREVAALIRFFPNILTPYWDKIWQLQTDQNEVLYSKDVERALRTGDTSIVDQHEMFQAIKDNTLDMRHSQDEQASFLDKYKNKSYDEIAGLESDHDDLLWSAEKEVEEQRRLEEAAEYSSRAGDLWGDFDSAFNLSDDLKTPAQKREEFLNKYKNRGVSGEFSDAPAQKKEEADPFALAPELRPDAGGITKTPGGYSGTHSLRESGDLRKMREAKANQAGRKPSGGPKPGARGQ